MTLFVAGPNHKTASVDVRESVAVEEEKLRDVQRDVQVLGVSTCNRVGSSGFSRGRDPPSRRRPHAS